MAVHASPQDGIFEVHRFRGFTYHHGAVISSRTNFEKPSPNRDAIRQSASPNTDSQSHGRLIVSSHQASVVNRVGGSFSAEPNPTL